MPNRKPTGYGLYTAIHKWRHGAKAIRLSPRGYRHDPLRAYEIALGLKPRRLVRALRRSKQLMESLGRTSSTGRTARKSRKA